MPDHTAIRFLLLFAALTLLTSVVRSQDKDLLLFIDSNTVIGKISGGKLYTGPDQVSLTLQGNRLYEGEYRPGDDPMLLIGVSDLFGKKTQKVFFEDAQDVAYTVRKGVVYLGDRSSYADLEQLVRIVPLQNGHYSVFSGITDSLIGTIATDRKPSPGELMTAVHKYVLHYNLDRQVNQRLESQVAIDEGSLGPGGSIKPAWESHPYYEWTWDGVNLKPAWGIRAEDEWTFDGKFIRPKFGTVSREEWQWDGQLLRKYWSTDVRMQWTWDRNGVLRRYWEGHPDEEWKYDGEMVQPHFNPDPRQTWIVQGEVPLPIIALVVLGYADR